MNFAQIWNRDYKNLFVLESANGIAVQKFIWNLNHEFCLNLVQKLAKQDLSRGVRQGVFNLAFNEGEIHLSNIIYFAYYGNEF